MLKLIGKKNINNFMLKYFHYLKPIFLLYGSISYYGCNDLMETA